MQLLDSLLASWDDLGEAARHLAETPGWTDGELRTVADVLAPAEAGEAGRPALAAALGELAGCLVVATEAEAHRAMARLHAGAKGAATFLVMERLKPVPSPPAPAGARPLAELVRALPGYERLPAVLLFDAYLVEDRATAEALAATVPAPARFFTRSGEWVDARGLLHGGGPSAGTTPAAARIGRRAQREAAREMLHRHAEALARAEAEVDAARAALDAVPFDAARAALSEAERDLAGAEKEQARLLAAREALEQRRAALAERRAALQADLDAVQAEHAALAAETEAAAAALDAARARRDEAEEAFRQADAESRAALNRHNEAEVAAVEARNRHDNLQRDLERTRTALADLDRRDRENEAARERLEKRQAELHTRLETLDREIDDLQAGYAGLETEVNAARDALLQTRAAISDLEARLRDVRRERENDLRQESQNEVRLAEVRTRLGDLLAHVEESFGRTLPEDPVPLEPGFDEQAARAEVQQLRAEIRTMGPVNALALETYREENSRLEFLTGQLRDLEEAEATLLSTIDEINTTASERFLTTFNAIRENFVRLFAELFGGEASADVMLADPDDPLESPIEIIARPRGKRPSTLAQLSGGEKTLTAIALLFAIYLVKPSPFCILDEVDAPLDDANIDRFMKLIRSFADSTQFILVTHNKRTMEAADRMYGITMQEQGVSQLVGVRFDEALALAEEQ
ncbi:AAA family ATPase [Rhodocaloribacter litoris]|uniref:AAA family ATPase n=1 Tax=Rhodocaloribacter litoris TaxID=2558931 RepID=UPI001E307A40|nr:AAA family ATPase [Rhodocaloribacter litoris]QXD16422.1 AAA family ATPase [Rhodocaloribacter litoris]